MDRKDIDIEALNVARKTVEDILVEWRDMRLSVISGNGFVIREKDGTDSDIMRLSTADGLRIGIAAYLTVIEKRTDGEGN